MINEYFIYEGQQLTTIGNNYFMLVQNDPKWSKNFIYAGQQLKRIKEDYRQLSVIIDKKEGVPK